MGMPRQATPEEAAKFTIEKTRTTAGYELFRQFEKIDPKTSMQQLDKRLEIKIEDVRIYQDGEASGRIFTRLDGGEWTDENRYVLSYKHGIIRIPASELTPEEQKGIDEDVLPDDFDYLPEEEY